MSAIKIGNEEYDEIPPSAVAASKMLVDVCVRLGYPETPLTPSGEKLMNVIIAIWEDLYPLEAKIWYDDRKEYQDNEMSITEQVRKGTGRSLASFPYPVYQMMTKVFPNYKLEAREDYLTFVKKFPMFRMANKA